MKIIPLSTDDLRAIVKWDIPYAELYDHFEQAFQSDETHPQRWYEEYVDINNSFYKESEHMMAAESAADIE